VEGLLSVISPSDMAGCTEIIPRTVFTVRARKRPEVITPEAGRSNSEAVSSVRLLSPDGQPKLAKESDSHDTEETKTSQAEKRRLRNCAGCNDVKLYGGISV
jgi:hypothetical protein